MPTNSTAHPLADAVRHFEVQRIHQLALRSHAAAKPNARAIPIGSSSRHIADEPGWICDERAMERVARLPGEEYVKGVPLSVWSYKGNHPGVALGVMAQDLEKRHPEAVRTGRDGLKRVVNPAFKPARIG